MKKKVIFLFLLVLVAWPGQSQNRTILSIDGGIKGDLYRLSDAGNLLDRRQPVGGYFGLGIAQELGGNWLIESGFRLMNYQFGIHFRDVPMMSYGNALHSWQIPFLVKFRLHDHKDRFSLTPFAGPVLGINRDHTRQFPSDHEMSTGNGSLTFEGTTYGWEEKGYTNLKSTFGLFEAGLTLDYRSRKGFDLFLGGVWQGGFSKIMQFDVTYQEDAGPLHTATYTSRGNNYRIMVGMRYALSRLWQEPRDADARQTAREHAHTLAQSRFYVGAEGGGLLNLFSSDNPEVTTDPVWENFSLGLYGGMRLWKPLWIETGIYTESYWNDFLFYHHDTFIGGGGFQTGGEGFLNIPLRLRYRYAPGEGRFALAPYAGVSLLTHTQGTGMYYETEFTSWSDDGQNPPDTTRTVASAYRLRTLTPLLNMGIGVEYSLAPRMILTFNAERSWGFSDINRLHVVRANSSLTQEGNIYYNGSAWHLRVGIRIPLGR